MKLSISIVTGFSNVYALITHKMPIKTKFPAKYSKFELNQRLTCIKVIKKFSTVR